MKPLEQFLQDAYEIHSSRAAVDETPYYGALETLFNEVGKTLKPRVRCIIHIKNKGAGLPDGGLFTAEQFDRKSAHEPREGQLPSRGAIEVKPPSDDAKQVAQDEQVTRYLSRYRQVLVTNLREFILVGHDPDSEPAILEKYELADSETAFWRAAAHPRKTADAQGVRLGEYLKRVMLHAAPLATPEDVAFFLASYARDALARIEGVELSALAAVRSALEQALGLKFEGEKGNHFFRSSLVQTLFYGVFSAWVLWSRQHLPKTKDRFDWSQTARLLRVPVIRKLFHEVADPGQLEALNLAEVLDWTAAVLNRVDRAQFFSKFQEFAAVQYFYEPFLEEFDPELRKQLGVWYTPHEIVKYMVERVDTVLRQELNLPDGLADKNVYVLDPCCGTGSYLVEVLNKIHDTLRQRGDDALTAADLKEAARYRVFGFEILPAPFVVSHLQLGLLLQNLGVPLAEKTDDRIGVYLTNSLTGWEPPKGPKQHLLYPEFEEERDASEHVKRETPILVILGNPPYNGFAGVSPAEEEGLLNPYKEGLKKWGITKNYLDDLYVRFFRVAERRIAEMTGRGIVCYISNFSYLSDPSFVVMRQRFLGEFSALWFDCLNGDSRETGKLTPEGKPDPSVFSTDYNRQGIRVGTAIGLMIRSTGSKTSTKPLVRFRHFWGVSKRRDLLASLKTETFAATYEIARPEQSNRFSFRPISTAKGYPTWPSLIELSAAEPMLGLNDNRAQALHDISRDAISERMQKYFDPTVPFEDLTQLHAGLASNAASFDAKETRKRLLKEDRFSAQNIWRFWFKPFDLRWAYVERHSNLWNRVRPELLAQAAADGNQFLLVRRHASKFPDGAAIYYSRHISDQHILHTDAYFIPFDLRTPASLGKDPRQAELLAHMTPPKPGKKPNLSPEAASYVSRIGAKSGDVKSTASIWLHSLAMGHAPQFLKENADGIRQDWPRIPLPNSNDALIGSAALGRQIATLLDIESSVKGVTTGDIRPELRLIGVITRAGGGSLKESDLALKAGWGHAGKGGITMPGKGRLIEREYSPAERKAILDGGKTIGLSEKELLQHLGQKTCDVYLNETAYWANVPARVWEYTIGGYQVIKKWLSYREEPLLGRPLTKDEARYAQEMARRIAAILLLEPPLDANYRAIKAQPFPWDTLRKEVSGKGPDPQL
jgi:Type ISP C-terminal specificity domain/N-6 DNA Methylase